MAELMSSAIIGEAVNRIISSHIGQDEVKYQDRENIERLEMAHIKMEAALQMSNRWPITDVPLLRWRSKLKRASQECDEALRRFERFAAGATEFLKYVEFGGTPREYMFFNPLIGHLLTGKSMRYQAFQESKYYYLGIRPMSFAEPGMEVIIGFLCHDFKEPTKGFNLGFILRISESTDIFNDIIKCMQSVTPHFKFAAEAVKRELIQLPTQDFSWVTQSPYGENGLWVNVHHTLTHLSRPNPLCCNEHEDYLVPSNNRNGMVPSSRLLSNTFPEEVIIVLLQCQVSLCDQQRYSMGSASEHGGTSYRNCDMPPLKLGVLFIPHDSPEDIEPPAESYVLEVIDETKQEMLHNNVGLQYLDEKLLPKAIDYLYQNSESKMYYYRCIHRNSQGCVATKEAQCSDEDPTLFDVVYYGTHTCVQITGGATVSFSSR
ncbi:hypothetical protein BAE44_0000085 [Dichanthelium oligosanthes]|uniref:WRKY domain-containing protein n=1 Tax=Dichanthelium oligosanthes TaxID=888268 RepID=A0A1E5WNB5_9POAL|nr:hypothetical protein BAE44_0000085 [Dichanthelium oligosanthes]